MYGSVPFINEAPDTPFNFSSHYVSWEVLFTRGRPRSAFSCIPVTFPVSKADHSRDGIPLRIHKHWDVLLFWHWASILFCFFPCRELVHFMLHFLNHLPESNHIKTFSTKHYLFTVTTQHLLFVHALLVHKWSHFSISWIDVVELQYSLCQALPAAVIPISLAAERRTLGIPHCMTHSCLLKS